MSAYPLAEPVSTNRIRALGTAPWAQDTVSFLKQHDWPAVAWWAPFVKHGVPDGRESAEKHCARAQLRWVCYTAEWPRPGGRFAMRSIRVRHGCV